MMQIKQDGIAVGGEEASFVELAGWIEELNNLAIELTRYEESEMPDDDSDRAPDG